MRGRLDRGAEAVDDGLEGDLFFFGRGRYAAVLVEALAQRAGGGQEQVGQGLPDGEVGGGVGEGRSQVSRRAMAASGRSVARVAPAKRASGRGGAGRSRRGPGRRQVAADQALQAGFGGGAGNTAGVVQPLVAAASMAARSASSRPASLSMKASAAATVSPSASPVPRPGQGLLGGLAIVGRGILGYRAGRRSGTGRASGGPGLPHSASSVVTARRPGCCSNCQPRSPSRASAACPRS